MDILLIIVFAGICIYGATQGVLRQVMSLGVIYVATMVAGLGYPYAATFVTAIGGSVPTLSQMIMFWVLFTATVAALEMLLRKGFPDVRFPKLGWIDNALGFLPSLLSALIVVTLILTSLGYSTLYTWKFLDVLRVMTAQGYDHSFLRQYLSQFLQLYMIAHTPWFPTVPPLLGYALVP